MASTYTTNLGIEKIGTGEQSGTWGVTTNENFDLIDEATNGLISITLGSAGSSGSPTALPITDGASSNGRNKFIEFVDGGDLGGTAYVQLTPNTAEKIVHFRNSLSSNRSVIVFQGTYNASNDFEVANGADVLLKFNGGGSGATVTDVNIDLTVTGLTVTTANVTTLNATTVDIEGGAIDGTIIGASSAAALTATTINGTTITGTTITANTAFVPDASDGAALGTASLEFSDLFLADGAVINFGDDQDITLTHVADTGLTLKHANSGDDKFPTFLLATGDNDIAADDKLGVINFQAPDESGGGDGSFVAAGIEAISEGDFGPGSNATSLVLKTGASEVAAEKARLTSTGRLGIGVSSPANGIHVANSSSTPIKGESTASGGSFLFLSDDDSGVYFGNNGSPGDAVIWTGSASGGSGGSEKVRVTSVGNVLIGGTATPASSQGNLVLFNGAAPSGSAANSVVLYAEDASSSSELKVRDEAGNVTTLSPHNFDLIPEGPSEDMAWSYFSEKDGKRINVDMLKVVRLLEKISGEKLVHES
jgi:hypothetical protein